jgi:hypothetical protein
MSLCLAAGSALVTMQLSSFTLAWTHSIEKVRWEEDYQVAGQVLLARTARIKGSAAGMEPPAGAKLKDGWWQYQPQQREHKELRLTRSPYAADYEVCSAGRCRSLQTILPQTDGVTRIFACPNQD